MRGKRVKALRSAFRSTHSFKASEYGYLRNTQTREIVCPIARAWRNFKKAAA